MARFTAFTILAMLAAAFVFNIVDASPAASNPSPKDRHLTSNAVEVPEASHTNTNGAHTVNLLGRQTHPSIHDEVPEGTPETDGDIVDLSERAASGPSDHMHKSSEHAEQNLDHISVDERNTKQTALTHAPSTKTNLPTSDRVVHGCFTGYAFWRRRCYRARSTIIRAIYWSYRGYNCRGKVFHFGPYICINPVCKARICYWRF